MKGKRSMPYNGSEKQKQTIWVRLIKRKLDGLCQKCPNPVTDTIRCATCSAKVNARRKPREQVAKLHARLAMSHVQFGGHDRKHNGGFSKALDWALTLHRMAHESV